jgi:hypothetical protein
VTGVIHFKGEWHHINYIPNSREFEVGLIHPDIAEFNTALLLSFQKPEEIPAVHPILLINKEIRNQPIPEKLKTSPIIMSTTTITQTSAPTVARASTSQQQIKNLANILQRGPEGHGNPGGGGVQPQGVMNRYSPH